MIYTTTPRPIPTTPASFPCDVCRRVGEVAVDVNALYRRNRNPLVAVWLTTITGPTVHLCARHATRILGHKPHAHA